MPRNQGLQSASTRIRGKLVLLRPRPFASILEAISGAFAEQANFVVVFSAFHSRNETLGFQKIMRVLCHLVLP